ncbi:twin-arginine translocase TatA/TatE family subunit [Streptomyces nodosus]|uniref:twin-arginine translocase TatA/TatE family subunit n=1 Tax=Streptomyces nodosus TaxID=40318 RepID=UPI0034526955
MFGMSELAVILLVVIVLVGMKKLPELMRAAGKATRILKSEVKALNEKDAKAHQRQRQHHTSRAAARGTTAKQHKPSGRS